jgi:hypothetical protein
MDTFNLFNLMKRTGYAYRNDPDDFIYRNSKGFQSQGNNVEDEILDKIDNERKAKIVRKRLKKKDQEIADLVAYGIVAKSILRKRLKRRKNGLS